jgi:hypothetical protein
MRRSRAREAQQPVRKTLIPLPLGRIMGHARKVPCGCADAPWRMRAQLTAGERGPLSMHAPAGKAVNLGHKAAAWATFCTELGACLGTPAERWAAYVMVAIHDVGKSDAFRAQARGAAWAAGAGCAARGARGRGARYARASGRENTQRQQQLTRSHAALLLLRLPAGERRAAVC